MKAYSCDYEALMLSDNVEIVGGLGANQGRGSDRIIGECAMDDEENSNKCPGCGADIAASMPSCKDCRLSHLMASDSVTGELLREDIIAILSRLSAQERDVLKFRFGLDDGIQRTLKEVGLIFGISEDAVRALEAAALKKLRHPKRNRRAIPKPAVTSNRPRFSERLQKSDDDILPFKHKSDEPD